MTREDRCGFIVCLLILTAALPIAFGTYNLDSGTTRTVGGDPSSILPAVDAVPLIAAPSVLPDASGARLSGQVAQYASDAAQNAEDEIDRDTKAGSTPALAAFQLADYEDSFLPTEEGLIDMTLGLWENEDFLTLTEDEAHDLLGLDDTAGFHGPGSMLSIAGPLPTIDDCRIGFQSIYVRRALQEVCAYDVLLVELGSIPSYRRDHWAAQRIQSAVALRDGAMLSLMEKLEEETTCGSWRLWWRLYRRWSQ